MDGFSEGFLVSHVDIWPWLESLLYSNRSYYHGLYPLITQTAFPSTVWRTVDLCGLVWSWQCLFPTCQRESPMLKHPRWASLDRIRGVWPKKYPGPLGPISYTNGAPTSPREFYPKTPFKTSYIHLPGLYEFYPPALAPKILYSLT